MKLLVLAGMILLCSCAPKPPAFDEYFPLAVGNRWEYQEKQSMGISPVPMIWTLTGTEKTADGTWYVLDKSGGNPPDEPRIFQVRFDGSRLLWRDVADNVEHIYVDFSRPIDIAYDAKPISRYPRDLQSEWKPPYHARNISSGPEFKVRLNAECCDRGANYVLTFVRGIGPTTMNLEAFPGPWLYTLTRASIGGRKLIVRN